MLFFCPNRAVLGLPTRFARVGLFQGSQVCSAHRFFRYAQKARSGLRPPLPIPQPAGLRPCRTKKYRLAGGEAAAGLAMCSSGPQGQTEPLKAAKGRAISELRNVAPTSAARRRPLILMNGPQHHRNNKDVANKGRKERRANQ